MALSLTVTFCNFVVTQQPISVFSFLFSEYDLKPHSSCASSTSCAARLELVCFSQHTLFRYLAPGYSGLMAQLDSDLFNDYCALRLRVWLLPHTSTEHSLTHCCFCNLVLRSSCHGECQNCNSSASIRHVADTSCTLPHVWCQWRVKTVCIVSTMERKPD